MAHTVANALVRRLRDWGVRTIYGYPGDGINGITGALNRARGNPRFIQARHEEMAAFMACGHAKFSGDLRAPLGPPRGVLPRPCADRKPAL